MLFIDLENTFSNSFILIFDGWGIISAFKSDRILKESIPFLGLGTLGSGYRQTSLVGDSPCNEAGLTFNSKGIEGLRAC